MNSNTSSIPASPVSRSLAGRMRCSKISRRQVSTKMLSSANSTLTRISLAWNVISPKYHESTVEFLAMALFSYEKNRRLHVKCKLTIKSIALIFYIIFLTKVFALSKKTELHLKSIIKMKSIINLLNDSLNYSFLCFRRNFRQIAFLFLRKGSSDGKQSIFLVASYVLRFQKNLRKSLVRCVNMFSLSKNIVRHYASTRIPLIGKVITLQSMAYIQFLSTLHTKPNIYDS